jgi:hypothetical protein
MSTRSRRTRGGNQNHAHINHITKGPIPNTETPIPTRNSKVTFSDTTIPRHEPITINTVLHVPDCPYSLDEIHFVLWYTFTTTLSPDKIAELFNHFFTPTQPIDRWAIADIFNVIETRWEANGKSFGKNFRLRRPTTHGTCPCDLEDFHIDCVDVKRTTKTRQNQKYLTIAASLWDESAADLVLCPRGNRKGQRHPAVAKDTQRPFPFTALDAIAALLQDIWHHMRHPFRTAATFTFWLSILHLWSAPPETITFPIQRTLSFYLHNYNISVLTILHCLFEGILDGFPTFPNLLATSFDQLTSQAVIRFLQMGAEVEIALLLCQFLGILPDSIPTDLTWFMSWGLPRGCVIVDMIDAILFLFVRGFKFLLEI